MCWVGSLGTPRLVRLSRLRGDGIKLIRQDTAIDFCRSLFLLKLLEKVFQAPGYLVDRLLVLESAVEWNGSIPKALPVC